MTKLLLVGNEVNPALERSLPGEGFPDVGLILSCGDLPYDYLGYLMDAFDVPLLYVHGNHDRPLEGERGKVVAPQGGTSVEGRVVEVGGLVIAGLGGSPRYGWGGDHQYTEAGMRRRVRKLARRLWRGHRRGRRLDVFLTHAPPRGIHDHPDPAHQGFAAFLPFLIRYQPRFLIHGHSQPRPGLPSRTHFEQTEVIHVRSHAVLEVPRASCQSPVVEAREGDPLPRPPRAEPPSLVRLGEEAGWNTSLTLAGPPRSGDLEDRGECEPVPGL